MTFFLGGIVSSAAKQARSYVRPFFLPALHNPKSKISPPPTYLKRAYDIASTLATLLVLNYAVAPFLLLDFNASIRAWNSLYWYGHIIPIGWLLWGNALGGFRWLGKNIKLRAEKAGTNEALKVGDRVDHPLTRTNSETFMVPPVNAAISNLQADFDRLKAASFNKAA